jgi:hypothetical protein
MNYLPVDLWNIRRDNAFMHKYAHPYFLSLVCISLLLWLVSCTQASPPQASSSDEPETQEQLAPADTGEIDKAGQSIEVQPAGDFLDCPPVGTPLYLELDHAVTFNYETMSLSHFLHQGYVQLEVQENGLIVTLIPGRLKYSMEGMMNPECSTSGEGQMTVTVSGTCEDGMVKLKIDEDWKALSAQMECVDEDGEVITAPFDAPAVGKMLNHGPDGEGEIFFLTDEDAGYVVMRPFEQGQGYHTWTLYTTLIPTVPLVP